MVDEVKRESYDTPESKDNMLSKITGMMLDEAGHTANKAAAFVEKPVEAAPVAETDVERPEAGAEAGDAEATPDTPTDGAAETPEVVEVEITPELTLTELAKKLGVKSRDLFDTPMMLSDHGDPVTLGTIKDKLQDAERIRGRETEIEEAGLDQENALMRARQELRAIVAVLPEITPELAQQAQVHLDNQQKVERVSLLDAVPAWRDATVKAADSERIVEHLKPYGFKAVDLAAVYDHRLLKYVRDNMLREQKFKAARDSLKPNGKNRASNKPTGKRPKVAVTPDVEKAAQSSDDRTKVSAIANLISQTGSGKR